MNHPDELRVIEIMRRGPAGDGFSPAEAAQMRTDMDTFLGTTIPQNLGDLNNVNVPSPSNGQVLRYNSGTGEWEPGNASPAVAAVDSGSIDMTAETGELIPGGPTFTLVTGDVKYAGTGSAATAARSDHSHNPAIMFLETFAATGNLSSGSRTILSSSMGPFLNGVAYDIHGTFIVRCRGAVDSGTITLSCRIGGSASFPARSRVVQVVGGVPVDQIIHFHRTITGDGTSATVTFQVIYSSGDPTDIRDGEVSIVATPRR